MPLSNRCIRVWERVAAFELADNCGLFDPATGNRFGIATWKTPEWAMCASEIVSESARRIGDVAHRRAGPGKAFFAAAGTYVNTAGTLAGPGSIALALVVGMAYKVY